MNDVIVIGGGLGGLACATLLARGGKTVTVLERARATGGRASTTPHEGFLLNLGPHALYRGGAATPVLRELGVAVSGGVPTSRGARAWRDGALTTLPGGLGSLLGAKLLPWRAKLEVARVLGALPRIDAARWRGTSMDAWLDATVATLEARDFVATLVRVTTYAADFAELDAGAALRQMRLGLVDGVVYLDGGWGRMVAKVEAAARAAGVTIRTGTAARRVLGEGEADGLATGSVAGGGVAGGGVRVELADGEALRASNVVIAAGPRQAAELTGSRALRGEADAALPSRIACLDVALASLPDPRVKLVLGAGAPLYLSVHTAYANLAPAGGAVIHVAKYLRQGEICARTELEALLDAAQPGWRARLVHARFLPAMVASNALVTARARPDVEVADAPGVLVCGDWVGSEGMLLDATLASASRAAHRLLRADGIARCA